MDNFNWGVRRPSLSHLDGGAGSGLDGDLSSAQESFNEVTPVLPKRETNAGVGAEESSDDETGSITVSQCLLSKKSREGGKGSGVVKNDVKSYLFRFVNKL